MAEELIQPDRGPQHSRAPGFVAAVFLLVLIGTGAAEVLIPPAPLILVGQERRDFSESTAQMDFWDGSLARSIETDFRLRGRVRRILGPYWSALMLSVGDTPDDELIVGKDGWLFLRDRVDLDPGGRARGREHLANLYSLVRRSLAAEDIAFVCVPIPRKAAACEEMLPDGIDGNLAYDRSVIEAHKVRGIDTVDVIPYWGKLPVADRYLRYDTHWALPARLETAKQIARQAPMLPRGQYERHFSYRYGRERLFTGSLRYAGIDNGHPANDFFEANPDREILLIPAGAEKDIASGAIPADVLFAGSSFSAHFWMQAILCNMLQTPVQDASEPGQMPLYSLRKRLLATPHEALPHFMVSEFPIHQAAVSGRGAVPTTRAAMGISRLMNYPEHVQPIPDEYFRAPVKFAPALDRPIVQYPEGSLLSSGDGVLGLGITFSGDVPSRWRYYTSGAEVEIGSRKGLRTRALPITESVDEIGFYAWLKPLSEPSLGTSVTTWLVTSADLKGGTNFRGESVDERRWQATPRRAVSPCDSLALLWDEFVTGPIEVRTTGTDSAGATVTRTWHFPRASKVRFLIVTLGTFENGTLDAVEVIGGGTNIEGTIASLIRAR